MEKYKIWESKSDSEYIEIHRAITSATKHNDEITVENLPDYIERNKVNSSNVSNIAVFVPSSFTKGDKLQLFKRIEDSLMFSGIKHIKKVTYYNKNAKYDNMLALQVTCEY